MSVPSVPSFETKVTPAGMSDAQLMVAFHDHFDASSVWTVELQEGGSGATAFAIFQTAGKTFQILFRIDTSIVEMAIDPQGTVTIVSSATGASADISPWQHFIQETSNSDTFLIQEWADFVKIFQRTNITAPVSYKEYFEAGLGVSGLGGGDVANGLSGEIIGTGDPDIGGPGTNDVLGAAATPAADRGSYIKTAAGTWQRVKSSRGAAPGTQADVDEMAVGGRVEPIHCILALNLGTGGSKREIAVHKYWFGYQPTAKTPGSIFDDDTNSRQMMIVGDLTGASFKWMAPVIDGFDPTA